MPARSALVAIVVLTALLGLARTSAHSSSVSSSSGVCADDTKDMKAVKADGQAQDSKLEEVLALPSGNGDATQVQLGSTIKLDALGPIIVNSDGTISRIANWVNLTDRERTVALRRIASRNKERVEKLSDEAAKGQP